MAFLKPSDRVDQEDLSSNSDKELTGGRRIKTAAGPSMLKMLATGTTEIGGAGGSFIVQIIEATSLMVIEPIVVVLLVHSRFSRNRQPYRFIFYILVNPISQFYTG